MSTLIRSFLVAAALLGTVSAASAAPYGSDNSQKSNAEKIFSEIARNGV
jgi:hypothetical protein